MKKTVEQKRLEFLNETVAHYNINNRCEANGSCRYNPKTLGLEGISEGCAIGRHISKRLASELDTRVSNTVRCVFDELPKKLKILGEDFLQNIQNLHDNEKLWNDEGLNENGLRNYNDIVKKFCIEE